jgi:putative ABC transport system substrate-binding protein
MFSPDLEAAMQRREFIGLIGGMAVWPLVVHAQQASKVWRIGYLGFGTAAACS